MLMKRSSTVPPAYLFRCFACQKLNKKEGFYALNHLPSQFYSAVHERDQLKFEQISGQNYFLWNKYTGSSVLVSRPSKGDSARNGAMKIWWCPIDRDFLIRHI